MPNKKNLETCFRTVGFLCFVVDALSIDHHIDAVVGELIQPSVERIVTEVWFGISGFVYKKCLIT